MTPDRDDIRAAEELERVVRWLRLIDGRDTAGPYELGMAHAYLNVADTLEDRARHLRGEKSEP